MLENIVKKVLLEEFKPKMVLTESVNVSDDLKYHLDNSLTLNENVFRIYSESYFNLCVANLHVFRLITLLCCYYLQLLGLRENTYIGFVYFQYWYVENHFFVSIY